MRRLRPGALFRWHRYAGALASVFLILVALTGVAVNHLDDVGLGDTRVTWSPLMSWYGLGVGAVPMTAFRAGDQVFAWVDGTLYDATGGESGKGGAGVRLAHRPVGAVAVGRLVAMASPHEIVLLTREGGDVVERLRDEDLPGRIVRLGAGGNQVFVQASGRLYKTDPSFLNWTAAARSESGTIRWSAAIAVPEAVKGQWRGEGLPLERVLLDLHSGRLWGGGAWMSDLSALAIVFLVVSGLLNWRQRNR